MPFIAFKRFIMGHSMKRQRTAPIFIYTRYFQAFEYQFRENLFLFTMQKRIPHLSRIQIETRYLKSLILYTTNRVGKRILLRSISYISIADIWVYEQDINTSITAKIIPIISRTPILSSIAQTTKKHTIPFSRRQRRKRKGIPTVMTFGPTNLGLESFCRI